MNYEFIVINLVINFHIKLIIFIKNYIIFFNKLYNLYIIFKTNLKYLRQIYTLNIVHKIVL